MKAIVLAAVLLAVLAPAAAAAQEKPKLKSTLTYERTGGIAGVDDKLRIKRDGWSLLNGREFRLRPSEREAVAQLVTDAKLERVKVKPKPADTSPAPTGKKDAAPPPPGTTKRTTPPKGRPTPTGKAGVARPKSPSSRPGGSRTKSGGKRRR